MEDFLPNDGANFDPSFTTPEDQEKEEREEKARKQASYPILDDLIADYERSIADADSFESMNIYQLAEANPQQAQVMFLAHREYVKKEKERLDMIKSWKQR